MKTQTAKILLAQDTSAMSMTKAAMTGFEVFEASTIAHARGLVVENVFTLFVIGVHFDHSQTLDLVKTIRGDDKHKNTPIIVVRLLKSIMVEPLRHTMEGLINRKTISEYLELERDPDAQAKLSDVIKKYCS